MSSNVEPATVRGAVTTMLTALVAASALAGGTLLIADPSGRLLGLGTALLVGTPLAGYRLPGLLLVSFVGGTAAVATIARVRSWTSRASATLLAGATLVVWMTAQLSMIGYIDALQPIMLGVGAALEVLGVLELIAHRRRQLVRT